MVRFRNVSKSYAKSSVLAVDDLTMDLKEGEIFGFLGPNGAGKTTTIKMMVGIRHSRKAVSKCAGTTSRVTPSPPSARWGT